MLDNLTTRLARVMKTLRGEARLTEENITDALREVRLALLEADGIIQRVQGSGNRVALSVAGYPGTTDLIAVLAHAQNVFFAAFMDHFQRTAERSDSLVLFKQVPASEALEASLFKLFQKNIRNAVIWLDSYGSSSSSSGFRKKSSLSFGCSLRKLSKIAGRESKSSVLLRLRAACSTRSCAALPEIEK